jgi:hypothetical protein
MRPTLALGLAAALAAGSAGAETIHVRNDALDADGCGAKSAPCRSITRAIAEAAAGDTILVGPGRYGDLDRDGVYGETGEENGGTVVLDVNKALRIFSTDGADATVIEAGGITGFEVIVRLTADGSQFGRRNGGFTVLGEAGGGTGIQTAGGDTVVAGNVVVAVVFGIELLATGSEAADNRVLLCEQGIAMIGDATRVLRNSLIGNDFGINIDGVDTVLDANVVVANGTGVTADSNASILSRMLIAGNRSGGMSYAGNELFIESSSFFGNGELLPAGGNCALSSEAVNTAAGNYWGSPLGPGPDPADEICFGMGTFEPFAKKGKTPKLKSTR